MHSFKFTADKHKLITHIGLIPPSISSPTHDHDAAAPSTASPPSSSKAKPDLLTRLIDSHPILHQLELILPSPPSPAPSLFPSPPRFYHIVTPLTTFLSSSFLLPHLSHLTAFTLSTPAPSHSSLSLSSSTLHLHLTPDTQQQLGLPSSPISIDPLKWQAGNKLYDRVQWCISRLQPVHLLVQWGGEGEVRWEGGMQLVREVRAREEEWREELVALVDVAAVIDDVCRVEREMKGKRREERRKGEDEMESQLTDLFDWFGLLTHRITPLLPPSSDLPLSLSVPLLPSSPLLALRSTGLLSSSHSLSTLRLAHSLLMDRPWVAVAGWGYGLGVRDVEGNAEDDWVVVLCSDGRFVLYQMINQNNSAH